MRPYRNKDQATSRSLDYTETQKRRGAGKEADPDISAGARTRLGRSLKNIEAEHCCSEQAPFGVLLVV